MSFGDNRQAKLSTRRNSTMQPINHPKFMTHPFGASSDEPGVVLTKVAGRTKKKPKRPTISNQPNLVSLDSLQIQLQYRLASSPSRKQLIKELVEINCNLTNALSCSCFLVSDGQLNCVAQHNPIAGQNLGIHQSSMLPTVSRAVESSKARVTNDGGLTVIAVPVFADEETGPVVSECLCVALNLSYEPAEPFLLITQVIATTISQWDERQKRAALDWQIDSTSAIAELTSKIVAAATPRSASMVATNELATFLNAPMVAIGFCPNKNSKRVRLQSMSGANEIDLGGKQARLIQSALQETLVRGTTTTLPALTGDDRTMKLAHQQLLESHRGSRLVSSPLTTSQGETIGAWLCLLPDHEQQQEKLARFAKVTGPFLADALRGNQKATQGATSRLLTQTSDFFGGKVGRMVMAGCLAVALLMMIPIPHRISCECVLQPTVRRFAVAPHDGILLESFVKPGDIVSAGQIIAQMDDRELRLQLSDLRAQQKTATKKRDVSRSARDAAATQIAELEIEQLNAQIDLIQFKTNNLDIKSTVAGIVLQGDLEDAQGAPVRTGDVLIEVAPLETLRLELNVPEADVTYVKPSQPTTVVLDGAPFDTLHGDLEMIRPASEVRDNQNVFVSEIQIDNQQKLLRPGMQGQAKITAGYRSLGWVLFHRPAERVFSIFR